MSNDLYQYQLNCPNEDPSICNFCSFFQGCERKYNLKGTNLEICIVLKEAIILFPNIDAFSEFCETFSLLGEPKYLDIDEIDQIADENDLEIITFN